MSESITINENSTKEGKYAELFPQLKELVAGETDKIANMANIAAALKEVFHFWWVGFYLVKENQLVLGPFQGPIACTRIPFSKGVCGACYRAKKTIIVDNVDEFPGHIACSSLTKSEIVIPILNNNEVIGVLDVDSEHLAYFNQQDAEWLEKIVILLT